MSTHYYIRGFISENNPEYQKQKKVLLACLEAEVSLPKETADYFGNSDPEKYLLDEKLEIKIPVAEWQGDEDENPYYEVKLKDLPSGVDRIRFIISC